ncbi:MAG: cyclic nucleotide-binding domain-containing protein, partial [Bacteroidales bacterium]
MNPKEIYKFLVNIELFRGLTNEELDELSHSIETQVFHINELLFEENGPRKDIFIIYKGEVELFKTPNFGNE